MLIQYGKERFVKRHHLFMVLIFALMVVGGCRFPVSPECAVFRHEEEMVRKGDFAVLADRRMFATMAFLNAAGFDEVIKGRQMYPARIAVRKIFKDKAKTHSEKFQSWKQY